MYDIALIRQAMKSALESINGLTATTRYDQANSNTALVGLPNRILYDEAAGEATIEIRVKVMVPNTPAGHEAFVSYLAQEGDASVKQALEADGTLGGKAQSIRVTEMEMAAPDYDALKATLLTADWMAQIFA